MTGIGAEWAALVEAVLAGMIVYSVYMCIRKFRRLVKHNLLVIAIEDMAFWVGIAIYLFVQIYYTSDGSIRWYFVLGVVFGMLILSLIARICKKTAKKMYAGREKKSGKSLE